MNGRLIVLSFVVSNRWEVSYIRGALARIWLPDWSGLPVDVGTLTAQVSQQEPTELPSVGRLICLVLTACCMVGLAHVFNLDLMI